MTPDSSDSEPAQSHETLNPPEPPLSKAEVTRRFPSLELISDDSIRAEVTELSRHAPAYFWVRPGSRSGYHNGFPRGLWKHTLALSPVIETLAPSLISQGHLTDDDIDKAHAAAILHDQLKAGRDGGETEDAHDTMMATVVREETNLSTDIADAIAQHMGPDSWSEGPPPQTELARLVHTADMIASADQDGVIVNIPSPGPTELTQLDSVSTVDLNTNRQ